jgi:hypothetical protein
VFLAGCNVFDYLIEGAKVTAVDLNAAQIALTELKAIACQKLTYEHFFEIFAKNKINLLKAKYESDIRPLLTKRSQQFWDSHIKTCVTTSNPHLPPLCVLVTRGNSLFTYMQGVQTLVMQSTQASYSITWLEHTSCVKLLFCLEPSSTMLRFSILPLVVLLQQR